MIRSFLTATLLATTALPAAAQVPAGNSAPQPVPIVDTIPEAKDVRYPGTLKVNVDATDTTRGIFRVTETIPVAHGTTKLTLLEPLWVPGGHAPRNSLPLFADIRFGILLVFLVVACGVVAYSARIWRIANAEDSARGGRGDAAGGTAGETGTA